MSNKKNNERLQQLEKQNADLKAALAGSRKAVHTLATELRETRDHSDDLAHALMRYENNIACRLWRWLAMRKRPTDILVEQWKKAQ